MCLVHAAVLSPAHPQHEGEVRRRDGVDTAGPWIIRKLRWCERKCSLALRGFRQCENDDINTTHKRRASRHTSLPGHTSLDALTLPPCCVRRAIRYAQCVGLRSPLWMSRRERLTSTAAWTALLAQNQCRPLPRRQPTLQVSRCCCKADKRCHRFSTVCFSFTCYCGVSRWHLGCLLVHDLRGRPHQSLPGSPPGAREPVLRRHQHATWIQPYLKGWRSSGSCSSSYSRGEASVRGAAGAR